MMVDAVRLLLFPALMAFAASSDLFTMTISNRISLALIVSFFALALVTGMGGHEILLHAGAGTAVLAITFCFFSFGWIGGGDAKLAAATALWFGFHHLFDYVVYASLFGGALTLLIIKFRVLPLPRFLAQHAWVQRLHESNGGVPYGIALALAALIVYPQTTWMQTFGL
jgi:prepilin peptidase CpaA